MFSFVSTSNLFPPRVSDLRLYRPAKGRGPYFIPHRDVQTESFVLTTSTTKPGSNQGEDSWQRGVHSECRMYVCSLANKGMAHHLSRLVRKHWLPNGAGTLSLNLRARSLDRHWGREPVDLTVFRHVRGFGVPDGERMEASVENLRGRATRDSPTIAVVEQRGFVGRDVLDFHWENIALCPRECSICFWKVICGSFCEQMEDNEDLDWNKDDDDTTAACVEYGPGICVGVGNFRLPRMLPELTFEECCPACKDYASSLNFPRWARGVGLGASPCVIGTHGERPFACCWCLSVGGSVLPHLTILSYGLCQGVFTFSDVVCRLIELDCVKPVLAAFGRTSPGMVDPFIF